MASWPMDPFTTEAGEANNAAATEFNHGRGMHADPANGDGNEQRGQIPYGPPYPDDQIRDMRAIKRMNVNDPAAEPDPYVAGNPDRYGAQRPLVRERGEPRTAPLPQPEPRRFKRAE